jgi:homoserine kinase
VSDAEGAAAECPVAADAAGVTVRAPASSANLGPGFDALGMALSLDLEVGFWRNGIGRSMAPESHPAVQAFRRAGGKGGVWVRSPIPMGRGLGFSGAARVAGIVAAHVQHDGPGLEVARVASDVLAMATELEGHADNVAPSLYGGVVATAAGRAVRVPLALEAAVVVWVPSSRTSTEKSRAALGAPVAFEDAVFNVGRTALLVAALAAGDTAALRAATEDRLHQERRFAMAAASRQALVAALDAGAWCGWLSGSGPSVASLCDPADSQRIGAALPDGASVKLLRIDDAGVRVRCG